ncbi:signal peptidase I [Flocculibacter collagenilyticus]|uniref:signal peptidase I n=1 Tax=Flocculibacter collagenilyticus TaxID=2744479 RepID=UPI0018F58B2A|nr:signal peptidase I [Flocculibacter collagenilyticus]
MAVYFSIFLVLLTLGSGLIWLIDATVFAPKRKEKVLQAQTTAGIQFDADTAEKVAPKPWLADTAQSIFPWILGITILRSFLYEPFQIPSGSMMPTLLVGDFILVEKYSYGVKDPVWRTKLVDTGSPERGDIAVFKYPLEPRIDYIKRIIGLPGDRIVYRNKNLYIKPACENDKKHCDKYHKIDMNKLNEGEFKLDNVPLIELEEDLLGLKHNVLINPVYPEFKSRYFKQSGTREDEWVVPEGHYFAMGDNRDNSMDSRYWGFVSDELLVGKAVFIWNSFEFDSSGESALPSFIPVGYRAERLGPIK